MTEEVTYQSELLQDEEYYVKAAEAAIFAYGAPLEFDKLADSIGTDERNIPAIINALASKYKDSAIEVLTLDGSVQMATRREYAQIVRNTLEIRRNQPLSRAALEVLAIIAYNQPATRALVDKVRGIESPSVVLSLCDKGLIEEKGRLDAPGRPMLYGTTPLFLRTFGLESIEQLDSVPELAEFSRQIAEQKQALMISDEAASKNVPGQLRLTSGEDALPETEADIDESQAKMASEVIKESTDEESE